MQQFGRRCSIGKYPRKSGNSPELSKREPRNLVTKIDSWTIGISSVVKRSRGISGSSHFFDGVTRLRVQKDKICYSAHLFERLQPNSGDQWLKFAMHLFLFNLRFKVSFDENNNNNNNDLIFILNQIWVRCVCRYFSTRATKFVNFIF